jgi:hypothetical protein
MSTNDQVGRATEQQPEPAIDAGCEIEMDRSVQGTGLPGFAQHRARASIVRDDADIMASFALNAADYELHDVWDDVLAASRRLIELLDDRSNAKGEIRRE